MAILFSSWCLSCRGCQQRLKQCDDAFREQLEAKQRSHDNHMMKIISEKDREIHLANQKVYQNSTSHSVIIYSILVRACVRNILLACVIVTASVPACVIVTANVATSLRVTLS